MKMQKVFAIEAKLPLFLTVIFATQHVFAMFGASVLVPIIYSKDPSIFLVMNGIGTLLFYKITAGKSPAFLGSSFAYISPTLIILANPNFGYEYALGGFLVSGILMCLIAVLINFVGYKWIDAILPPAAMGSIVALIGFELLGIAAKNCGFFIPNIAEFNNTNAIISAITILTAIFGAILLRGFAACISILLAIIVGYFASYCFGIIDFTLISKANIISIPEIIHPKFSLTAIQIILPATIVVINEHIGHQFVTGTIVGKNLIKSPGLFKTLLSDGLSTIVSAIFGSGPTTTYAENMGVMSITKIYASRVLAAAGLISIILGFCGIVSAFIMSIPTPVISGISLVLYAMIGASGIRLIVNRKVDYSKIQNLLLTVVVFGSGLSGISLKIGEVQITGMCLASIVGLFFGTSFWILNKLGLSNETPQEYISQKETN